MRQKNDRLWLMPFERASKYLDLDKCGALHLSKRYYLGSGGGETRNGFRALNGRMANLLNVLLGRVLSVEKRMGKRLLPISVVELRSFIEPLAAKARAKGNGK